ncbi:MAG: hypothetical protein ACRD5J_17580, partial [Nitrososphaeraceae archaeon]
MDVNKYRSFYSKPCTNSNFLLLSIGILLVIFVCLIPDGVAFKSNSAAQTSIYEVPDLGIRIEHPADWKAFERTSTTVNANIIEFVPKVESEHDPLSPYFSISIEDFEDMEMSKKAKGQLKVDMNVNGTALKALTERNMRLAESLPDFNIVELNRSFLLSDIPAYKIVYTFSDPGSPIHPVFESMSIWAIREDRAYTLSYT